MLERFKLLKKGKVRPKMLHIALTTHGIREWANAHTVSLNSAYERSFSILREIMIEHVNHDIPILTIFLVPEFFLSADFFSVFLESFIPFFSGLKSDGFIHKHKVKVSVLGKWYDLPGRAVDVIKDVIESTKDYDDYFLNFCINYDGQEEIVDACRLIARKVKADRLDVNSITKETVKDSIYASYFLPPDLLIKNGLHQTSGLLLWDSPQTSIVFGKKYFPDFSKNDFLKAFNP